MSQPEGLKAQRHHRMYELWIPVGGSHLVIKGEEDRWNPTDISSHRSMGKSKWPGLGLSTLPVSPGVSQSRALSPGGY